MSKVSDTKKVSEDAKPSTAAAKKAAAKTEPAQKDPTVEQTAAKSTEKSKAAGTAKTPVAPRKSSGSPFLSGFGIAVVLVLALVIGGVMTLKDWYPAVEPYVGEFLEPFMPEDTEEESLIAALEARLVAIEESNAGVTASAIADLEASGAELTSQIASIMSRLESAERSISNLRTTASALSSSGSTRSPDVDLLIERLSEVETANDLNLDALEDLASQVATLSQRQTGASATAVQNQAMVLVVGQISRAINAGEGFADPLRSIAAVADGDPAIQDAISIMQPHAAGGVATLETLRRTFADDAGAIVRAGGALEENNWIDAAVNKVASLVTVRRIDGEGDPASVDAIVATAEDRLAAGDLDGAIAVVDALESGAAEAASAWLAAARARQEVMAALGSLHDLAVSRLQGEG